MAVIRDLVREIGDLRFQRRATISFLPGRWRIVEGLMFLKPFPNFKREIQPWKTGIGVLEKLHYALALLVVVKPTLLGHAFGQHLFAGMPKRRMTQVMGEGNRLRQIFVEP